MAEPNRQPPGDSAAPQISHPALSRTTREDACVLVIFGGAGDLSHKKLLPALYNLALDRGLPERFAIVAFSMEKLDDEGYRKFARDGIEHFSRQPLTEQGWNNFAPLLHFVSGSFDEPADYQKLKERPAQFDHDLGTGGNH